MYARRPIDNNKRFVEIFRMRKLRHVRLTLGVRRGRGLYGQSSGDVVDPVYFPTKSTANRCGTRG